MQGGQWIEEVLELGVQSLASSLKVNLKTPCLLIHVYLCQSGAVEPQPNALVTLFLASQW